MSFQLENQPWIQDPNYKTNPYYDTLSQEQKEQIDFYVDKGYLILDNFDLTENIDLDKLKSMIEPGYDWQANRVQDAFKFCPQVKQIACNEKVLDLLKIIYNKPPVPFQTLNFIKGTQQATHSDFIHFNTIPYHYMCGVWVALEDVGLTQGPLHYYEASHKLEEMEYEKFGLDLGPDYTNPTVVWPKYTEYEEKIKELTKGFEKKELQVKKGQCLIWASNLLHGGSMVADHNLTRWSQVTHYIFDDTIPITPMMSLPSKNQWMLRNPTNVLTGKNMNRTYNGKKVEMTLKDHRGRFEIKVPE